jgi:hypothetical protein
MPTDRHRLMNPADDDLKGLTKTERRAIDNPARLDPRTLGFHPRQQPEGRRQRSRRSLLVRR